MFGYRQTKKTHDADNSFGLSLTKKFCRSDSFACELEADSLNTCCNKDNVL